MKKIINFVKEFWPVILGFIVLYAIAFYIFDHFFVQIVSTLVIASLFLAIIYIFIAIINFL